MYVLIILSCVDIQAMRKVVSRNPAIVGFVIGAVATKTAYYFLVEKPEAAHQDRIWKSRIDALEALEWSGATVDPDPQPHSKSKK